MWIDGSMHVIELRSDPQVALRDAELKLRMAWIAVMKGGARERQVLIEAARECFLARAAVRGRYRVFRPSTRT